jgi:curved DNA-binding protein CbpA
MLDQNFYEVLEILSEATPQDVERAYRIARATYQPASTATYSLFSDDENAEILQRIEEAYAVLSDARMRREYDARLRREGVSRHAQPASSAPVAVVEPPPLPLHATGAPGADAPEETEMQPVRRTPDFSLDEPDEPADGVYDGPALRRVRIRHGIELDEIAERTKINESHLASIEQNRYETLPSGVYLRGFLREYARCLKLDPKAVADSYMSLLAANERRPGRA